MGWELSITAILAVIGGLTVIGWLANLVLRRGAIAKPTVILHFFVENCATEVEGALRSLLLFSRPFQRWTLKQIKITDLGSTDETAAIVRKLAAQTPIIEFTDDVSGICVNPMPATIELVIRAGETNGWDLRSACDAICALLD